MKTNSMKTGNANLKSELEPELKFRRALRAWTNHLATASDDGDLTFAVVCFGNIQDILRDEMRRRHPRLRVASSWPCTAQPEGGA